MLEAVDLAAVRGDRRLFSGIGFSLQQGELLHVQGVNGSGKTTLLRMLCGLVVPEAGDVLWEGKNIRAEREAYLRNLLYLGHLGALKDDLTGLENLRVTETLAGESIGEDQALDALQAVGLHGHEDLPVRVLSQGQRRRVALARLTLSRARLWILDEPFTALDKASVETLRARLEDHLEQGGMVILTTHQEIDIDAAVVKQVALG
ncbi:MAG TPA: cytochrome c biogenesis heme-transporting ATPase CcmA [Gammaproteobacteria bacterium]|nr:cytochrome c biogenesis heme-transporting ATPase CcmA [Gammaproteobacteria bacterium]